MKYELRHFDRTLFRFEADKDASDPGYQVLWVDGEAQSLLPYGLDPTPAGIGRWIRQRAISEDRTFADALLAYGGLRADRPLEIIVACKGLSLNDCYWVCEAGCEDTFSKVNLYQNPMSRRFAEVAFTGQGSSLCRGFSTSAEFTTKGMLPKCWRRICGKIYLFKGGTTGAVNTGFEPYSEYYAAEVARAFGAHAVDYELCRFKGIICSSCELFTSLDWSYVPMADVVTSGGFAAVAAYCERMGESFSQALSEMLAFDALIGNTDRHYNNFGFLADSHNMELVAFAPLFDHGNALYYQAFGDDWLDDERLQAYASTFVPRIYDDFFETAKTYMTRETRAKVQGMREFEFSRYPRARFTEKRLRMIERQVRYRSQRLLG